VNLVPCGCPSFVKIVLHVCLPGVLKSRKLYARLLGNICCYGNCFHAHILEPQWNYSFQVSSKSVHAFNLQMLNFLCTVARKLKMAVTMATISYQVCSVSGAMWLPKFYQNCITLLSSRCHMIKAWIFNARLLGNRYRYDNRFPAGIL